MKKLSRILLFILGSIGVLVVLVMALDQYEFNFKLGPIRVMSTGFVKSKAGFKLAGLDKDYLNDQKYIELLINGNYDELSKLCTTALMKQRTDLRYDSALVKVLTFQTWKITQQEITDKVINWRIKDKNSDCSTIALALSTMYLGVSGGQNAGSFLKESYRLATEIREKTNSTIAYYILINLAPRLGAAKGDIYRLIEQAEQVCPQCYLFRRASMVALSPFWYGSAFEMESFAEASLEYIDENPQLIDLKAFSRDLMFDTCIFPGPAYSSTVPKEKIKKCAHFIDEAIDIKPDPRYVSKRVDVLLRLEDDKVMKDLQYLMENQVEEFKPYYGMGMAHFRAMRWEESSKYLALHLKYTKWKLSGRAEYMKKMQEFYTLELETRCQSAKNQKLCSEYEKAKASLEDTYKEYIKLPDYEEALAKRGKGKVQVESQI